MSEKAQIFTFEHQQNQRIFDHSEEQVRDESLSSINVNRGALIFIHADTPA
jgi:hypothetical protein